MPDPCAVTEVSHLFTYMLVSGVVGFAIGVGGILWVLTASDRPDYHECEDLADV